MVCFKAKLGAESSRKHCKERCKMVHAYTAYT